jgi:hypothetical protein
MKIQGREITANNYLDPVTYVPAYAKGNAGHKDCERGVITRTSDTVVFVLYCRSRTVQGTNPDELVWG